MTVASGQAASAEGRTELVPTQDGRELGVCQWGDLGGAALFLLHGTPGSRFLRHPGGGYVDHRLRVITYDRPGYGVSTRSPGHRVADAAAEIACIADTLGLDRFGVAGVSGGGPRALAAAALLPDRVTRCATVVGVGPVGADGLDHYAGMNDEARAAVLATLEDGEALDRQCEEAVGWVEEGMPGLTFPDDGTRPMLLQAFTEAFRQGVGGFRDDRLALVRDWGFTVADVSVPTRVMVGVDDTSVPPAHGEWVVAHVRDARLLPVPGDHFGPRGEPEMELMAWAAGAAPRPGLS